jgi:hypothetical protein
MTAQILLSRLDRVKRTGSGRWIARCPAHDDRGPSLAIRELDDGRVVVHCFAGCEAESVLGAVGLSFSDLYPEKRVEHGRPERRPFPAADVLRAIAFESTLVMVTAAHLLAGHPLSEGSRERLALAVSRIQAALKAAGVEA